MTTLSLRYPVRTLEGSELLPAGTILSGKVLDAIAAGGRKTAFREIPILAHSTVRRDILAQIAEMPYSRTFGDRSDVAELLETMGKVRLPAPVLEALDYFKRMDRYTYRHVLMVFALSCRIAGRLPGNPRKTLFDTTAGPLHDFGKIGVPLGILRKCTPLKRSEKEFLEHHAAAGFVLLTHYLKNRDRSAAVVARDHHERRDRSGYPRGIRLSEAFVEIVAVCDVYDALVSPRPYRERSFDNRTALEEITRMGEEGKISWKIVKVLVALNRKDAPPPAKCAVSTEKRGRPPEGNLYGVVVEDDAPAAR